MPASRSWRPVVALVPFGLMGTWSCSSVALATELDLEPDPVVAGQATAEQAVWQQSATSALAPTAQPLAGAEFQVRPEVATPKLEWAEGIEVAGIEVAGIEVPGIEIPGIEIPIGPRTRVTGGVVVEPTQESMEAWHEEISGNLRRDWLRQAPKDRWHTQAALGLKHQWQVRPGMEAEVSYERMLGDIIGSSSSGGANRVKANLDYQIRPHWSSSVRLEQRVGSRENQLRMSAGVTGQVSPRLTAQVSARRDRQTDKAPKTQIRAGLSYTTATQNTAGEAHLAANLQYEYRQYDNSAHLLKASANYRPSDRWDMSSMVGVRQQEGGKTAALAQVGLSHRFSKRLDCAGDLRLRQGFGGGEAGGLGATVEMGYRLNPRVRLSAGYAVGKTKDDDFRRSQSSGPYVDLQLR